MALVYCGCRKVRGVFVKISQCNARASARTHVAVSPLYRNYCHVIKNSKRRGSEREHVDTCTTRKVGSSFHKSNFIHFTVNSYVTAIAIDGEQPV